MRHHKSLGLSAMFGLVNANSSNAVILPKLKPSEPLDFMPAYESILIDKSIEGLGLIKGPFHQRNILMSYVSANVEKENGSRKFDFRVLHREEVIDAVHLEKDAEPSNEDLAILYLTENKPVNDEVEAPLLVAGKCPVTQHDATANLMWHVHSKIPSERLARILAKFPELDPKFSTGGVMDKRLTLSDLATANISYAIMPTFVGKTLSLKDKKAFRDYAGKSIFINDRKLKKDSLTVIIFPNKTYTANPTFCKQLEDSIMSALTYTHSSKVYLFNAPTNLLALTNLPTLKVTVSEDENGTLHTFC